MATLSQILADTQFGAQAKQYLELGMPETQIIALFGAHIDLRTNNEPIPVNIADNIAPSSYQIDESGTKTRNYTRLEKAKIMYILVLYMLKKGRIERGKAIELLTALKGEIQK